jgi:lipopolysaccharide exporter
VLPDGKGRAPGDRQGLPPSPPQGSILARTAKGAGWIIGFRLTSRLLGLVNTLTLVRLLLPADFGLVALATSFAEAVDTLSALGVEEAVIREPNPTRALYDTGFTLNVLRGLGTAAIVAGAALPVAAFFKEPRLVPVLLALAIGSLALAFENIGIVDFRRDLAFDKEFKLLLVPRIVSIVVTIGLAAVFRSYWALVIGILTSQGLRVTMGYVMHPYRPGFQIGAWRQIAGFSFWTWALSIANLVRNRSDSFVIGRALNPTEVGVYAISVEVAAVPTIEVVGALARASFSGFVAARDAGLNAAQTYLRILASMALLTLPAGFGISLVADPVVRLAVGARWLEATPLIEILGVAGTFVVLGMISAALFSAHALLGAIFRLNLVSMAVRVTLMVLLVAELGLIGAAIAATAAMAFDNVLYVILTCRHFGLRASDLLRRTWRPLLATGAMTAVLYLSGLGWHPLPGDTAALARKLLVAVPTGAAVYGAVLGSAWFLAGRPRGAETDLAELVWRPLERLLRKARPGLRPGPARGRAPGPHPESQGDPRTQPLAFRRRNFRHRWPARRRGGILTQ